MFDNKNFRTTARWIVINDNKKILLVQHQKGKSWVLPWWHIEKFESPHEWLVRELKEEFQIKIQFIWNKLKTEDKWIELLPLPIDSYIVNYFHKKYWDVNRVEYIFLCKHQEWILTPQKEEIYDYKWLWINEILKNKYQNHKRVKELVIYIEKYLK